MKTLFILLVGATVLIGVPATFTPTPNHQEAVNIAPPTIDSIVEVKLEMVLEKRFYSNGKVVKAEGFSAQNRLLYHHTYYDGQMHGKWLEFYENGELYQEIDYFLDQPHGYQKVYYSNGESQYWIEWINGVQMSRVEAPKPIEKVLAKPKWKTDGC